jgi:hypothetical protein
MDRVAALGSSEPDERRRPRQDEKSDAAVQVFTIGMTS